MEPIKLKHWLIATFILIILGLLADYYFIHILFHQKTQILNGVAHETIQDPLVPENPALALERDELQRHSDEDNFLATLQSCLPEISAQGIATPEALMAYFKKSIGIHSEIKDIQNYQVRLADGHVRRIQVSHSDSQDDIQLYELDPDGEHFEKIEMKEGDSLTALLSQGEMFQQDSKERWKLKDGSSLSVELHNKKILQFHYAGHGKKMLCYLKNCSCP